MKNFLAKQLPKNPFHSDSRDENPVSKRELEVNNNSSDVFRTKSTPTSNSDFASNVKDMGNFNIRPLTSQKHHERSPIYEKKITSPHDNNTSVLTYSSSEPLSPRDPNYNEHLHNSKQPGDIISIVSHSQPNAVTRPLTPADDNLHAYHSMPAAPRSPIQPVAANRYLPFDEHSNSVYAHNGMHAASRSPIQPVAANRYLPFDEDDPSLIEEFSRKGPIIRKDHFVSDNLFQSIVPTGMASLLDEVNIHEGEFFDGFEL